MKKVAVIFEGSIYNRKGLVNAVIERAKRYNACSDFDVDVFCIMNYENRLIRTLRHTPKIVIKQYEYIEGLKINILWNKFSLLDYITEIKLQGKAKFKETWLKRCVDKFKDYDLIMAHSYSASLIGLYTKKKFGIPYSATWHGSDIHTAPKKNQYLKNKTKQIIDNADVNFFVSKALLESAKEITNCTKTWNVSYNGASDMFFKFNEDKRLSLRKQYGVLDKKVIAFVGNLVDIKNVFCLPEIFKRIQNEYYNIELSFWIIGDGKLRNQLQQEFNNIDIDCKIWGNQKVDMMPNIMNCIDVLILPSKNEGLPLVTVEALRCGTNVVGSNVGGIKEVIGKENVFDLNDNFSEHISNRVIQMLNNKLDQDASDEFVWENVIEKEFKICSKIFEY